MVKVENLFVLLLGFALEPPLEHARVETLEHVAQVIPAVVPRDHVDSTANVVHHLLVQLLQHGKIALRLRRRRKRKRRRRRRRREREREREREKERERKKNTQGRIYDSISRGGWAGAVFLRAGAVGDAVYMTATVACDWAGAVM